MASCPFRRMTATTSLLKESLKNLWKFPPSPKCLKSSRSSSWNAFRKSLRKGTVLMSSWPASGFSKERIRNFRKGRRKLRKNWRTWLSRFRMNRRSRILKIRSRKKLRLLRSIPPKNFMNYSKTKSKKSSITIPKPDNKSFSPFKKQ